MLKLAVLSLLLVAVARGAEPRVKYVVALWRVDTMTSSTPDTTTTITTREETTPTTTAQTMDHIQTPVCTGAILSKEYVLTTEACADATANTMGIHITAGVSDLTVSDIDQYFHVVTDVIKNPPFALLKVKTNFAQEAVPWRKSTTSYATTCSFTYWNTDIMRQHPFANLETVECPADDLGKRICAKKPGTKATAKLCDKGADGAVLICGGELAGMWGGPLGCNSFFFQEVQQVNDWIKEYIPNGAMTPKTTIFALITLAFLAIFVQ